MIDANRQQADAIYGAVRNSIDQNAQFTMPRTDAALNAIMRERQMYELAIDTLSAAGYEHYEVSNFARPGHRCRPCAPSPDA